MHCHVGYLLSAPCVEGVMCMLLWWLNNAFLCEAYTARPVFTVCVCVCGCTLLWWLNALSCGRPTQRGLCDTCAPSELGVCLWQDLRESEIVIKIVNEGLRPTFPPGVPQR
jgi:hypothetical protein